MGAESRPDAEPVRTTGVRNGRQKRTAKPEGPEVHVGPVLHAGQLRADAPRTHTGK